MLKQLVIKNFIFIKDAAIDFSPGFNVITGETGAGKSILLNALGITLGNKIDLGIITPGKDKIEVTSVFDITNNSLLKKKYEHLGLSDDPNQELVLKREISQEGKSRCLINGNPVNLGVLKEISERLIDIHSQHQNQYLFNSDHHLYFFDQTLDIKEALTEYKKRFFQYKEINKRFTDISIEEQQLKDEKEFLLFSAKEFEGKFLDESEYYKLKERLKEIENLEKNQSAFVQIKDNFNQQGFPALEKALLELGKLNLKEDIQKKIEELRNQIEQVRETVEMILQQSGFQENHSYLHEIDGLNQMLSGTEKLLRKYNSDHSALFSKYENIKNKLERLENLEFEKNKLENALRESQSHCLQAAKTLREIRQKGIPDFEQKINEQILDLEIKNSSFIASLGPDLDLTVGADAWLPHLNDRGMDKLEFLFSPGKGVEPKPLKKIASGGELSRIMLAIKYLLNQSLPNESIIFDEIDTGVGGIAAVKIGQKIKEISRAKQVIVITHLTQIAKCADKHFRIEKSTDSQGKTETAIEVLSEKEILAEFTRMMGKEATEENIKLTEKIIYEK